MEIKRIRDITERRGSICIIEMRSNLGLFIVYFTCILGYIHIYTHTFKYLCVYPHIFFIKIFSTSSTLLLYLTVGVCVICVFSLYSGPIICSLDINLILN